jgi:hypothetical protein
MCGMFQSAHIQYHQPFQLRQYPDLSFFVVALRSSLIQFRSDDDDDNDNNITIVSFKIVSNSLDTSCLSILWDTGSIVDVADKQK